MYAYLHITLKINIIIAFRYIILKSYDFCFYALHNDLAD